MLLSCQDVKSREKSDLSDADVKLWQINTLLQCSYSCPGCSSALYEVVIQISNCSLDLHFTHKRFPGRGGRMITNQKLAIPCGLLSLLLQGFDGSYLTLVHLSA